VERQYDFVAVFNAAGVLLRLFSGTLAAAGDPVVTSTDNTMVVVMKSDYSQQYTGFAAHYRYLPT
jgi:hypothetical protein